MANNAINADAQKRRFALLYPAGYGERWTTRKTAIKATFKDDDV